MLLLSNDGSLLRWIVKLDLHLIHLLHWCDCHRGALLLALHWRLLLLTSWCEAVICALKHWLLRHHLRVRLLHACVSKRVRLVLAQVDLYS